MKKIDDILNSLQQQRPVISDPDELTNRIIDSLPDLDCPKAKPAKRVRILHSHCRRHRCLHHAACHADDEYGYQRK